jgi:hypothetical protein
VVVRPNSDTSMASPLPIWAPLLGTLVASFDGATDATSRWSFLNGSEFPGATGALTEVPSSTSGKAAKLTADLGCGASRIAIRLGAEKCGTYVAMSTPFASGVTLATATNPVLALDVKFVDFSLNAAVRLTDNTGQVHQYPLQKGALEAQDGSQWRAFHLPVATSTTHWGGVNDGNMHLPIKAVQLMAVKSEQLEAPTSILFDNLKLLGNPSYEVNLQAGAIVHPAVFKSYVGRTAVCTHSYDAAATEKAKAVGLNVVRRDIFWSAVEKNGAFDFASYNKDAAALAAKGVSVLWILAYGHPDHGGSAPLTAADQAAFVKYAAAVANNFKGKNVYAYEVWNEPNAQNFWPTPDPVAYAGLLTKTATVIKAVDPAVPVITGGTAGLDINYLIKMAPKAAVVNLDAVSVHPYSYPLGADPEELASGYQRVKTTVKSYGLNKPVWVSEWGISSFGEFSSSTYGNGMAPAARARQGALVLRMVLSQIALNVPVISIYSLMDSAANGSDREANFGLLTSGGSEKPAYTGLKALFEAQTGRDFAGVIGGLPPGVHALRWDGAADRTYALWVDRTGPGSVKINLPAKTASSKWWTGTAVTVQSGSVALTEAAGPLFVRVLN